MIKRLFIGAISFFLVVFFQNCSRDHFSSSSGKASLASASGSGSDPANNPYGNGSDPANSGNGSGSDPSGSTGSGIPDGGGVSTTSCHNFGNVTAPLKIIVMVDNSGSTFYTDPNQQIVQNALSTFLTNYSSKNNFQYNFSYFADTTPAAYGGTNDPLAISLINNGNNQDPIFGNAAAMTSAMQQWSSVVANGETPYKAAFNMIAKTISDDPNFSQNKANQNYAILFMSDGLPTDFGNPFYNSSVINYMTSNIENLSQGHISFSTVYVDKFNAQTAQQEANSTGYALDNFYDQDSMALLQQLAQAGNGQFVNTTVEGLTIDLSNALTLPSSLCSP